jgi:hypothetical protein
MLSSQAFILDVSGYLLLKSGENSDIVDGCTALSDQRWFCRSFDYGAIVNFSKNRLFYQTESYWIPIARHASQ